MILLTPTVMGYWIRLNHFISYAVKGRLMIFLLSTLKLWMEPQKQTFNICHHLLVSEVIKNGIVVAKFHLADLVGVTHHNVPGCSNNKSFLRLGIRNITTI